MKHRTNTHHVEDRDGLRVPALLQRLGLTSEAAELDAMVSTIPRRRHGNSTDTTRFPRVPAVIGQWATDRAVPMAVTA